MSSVFASSNSINVNPENINLSENKLLRGDSDGKGTETTNIEVDVEDNVRKVNSLTLVTNPIATPDVAGLITFNPTDKLANISTGLGTVIDVGGELVIEVFNATGSVFLNGTILHPAGTGLTGGLVHAAPAIASNHLGISGTIAVATMDIPAGQSGFVTVFGRVKGLDTSLDTLGPAWVSDTLAGDAVSISPVFPSYAVSIGGFTVIDSVDGEIFVDIQGSLIDTIINYHNGTFREKFKFPVTSDGLTITGSLSPSNGQSFLTAFFSDGLFLFDLSTPETIELIAGTAEIPQTQYVYITKANKVLEVSTGGYPYDEEHTRVAKISLHDAVTTQTYEADSVQFINDPIQSDNGQGGRSRETDRQRQNPAQWSSGMEGGATIVSLPSPDDVFLTMTAGVGYQLGRHTSDARDMEAGDFLKVFNDSISPNKYIDNHNLVLLDSNGDSLTNRSFSTVLFLILNSGEEADHLAITLPSGSYNQPTAAIADSANYSNYTPPANYDGTIIPIARYTWSLSASAGGTWTLEDVDNTIKGRISGGGGGGGGTGSTSYDGLVDTPASKIGNAGKSPVVDATETVHEYKDLTTYRDTYNITNSTAGTLGVAGSVATVSQGIYKTGQLRVYIDGIRMYVGTAGSGQSIEETNPALGTFTINVDFATSGIDVDYKKE